MYFSQLADAQAGRSVSTNARNQISKKHRVSFAELQELLFEHSSDVLGPELNRRENYPVCDLALFRERLRILGSAILDCGSKL